MVYGPVVCAVIVTVTYMSHILMSSLALCTIYHLVLANQFADMHLSVVYIQSAQANLLGRYYISQITVEVPHICVYG